MRLVTPFYRAARSLARLNERVPDFKTTALCVELSEMVKFKSQRLERSRKPAPPRRVRSTASPFDDLLKALPVNIETLRSVCPPRSAVLFFSLAHETAMNPGFWFSTLILPHQLDIAMPKCMPFSQVYDPHLAVESVFRQSRESLASSNAEEGVQLLGGLEEEMNHMLAQLGDALMPPHYVEQLQRRGIERLYIAPEAYLFETPWAALRVQTAQGRRWLCELGCAGGPLKISVLPCLATLAPPVAEASPVEPRAPLQPLGAMLTTQGEWRTELPAIGSLSARFDAAVVRASSMLGSGEGEEGARVEPKVETFLRMLRYRRIGIFMGHGEGSELGTQLVLEDGVVGEVEIAAAHRVLPLATQVVFMLACSGLRSRGQGIGREVSGAHMALVRSGVRCVVGSPMPMFPVTAMSVLETAGPAIAAGLSADTTVEQARQQLRRDPRYANPTFWGHLVCFGDGSVRLDGRSPG